MPNTIITIRIRKRSDEDYTVRVFGGHKWTFNAAYDVLAKEAAV